MQAAQQRMGGSSDSLPLGGSGNHAEPSQEGGAIYSGAAGGQNAFQSVTSAGSMSMFSSGQTRRQPPNQNLGQTHGQGQGQGTGSPGGAGARPPQPSGMFSSGGTHGPQATAMFSSGGTAKQGGGMFESGQSVPRGRAGMFSSAGSAAQPGGQQSRWASGRGGAGPSQPQGGAPPATAQLMDDKGNVRFQLPLRRPHRRRRVEGFEGVSIDECGGLRIELGDVAGTGPSFSTESGASSRSSGPAQSGGYGSGVEPPKAGVKALLGAGTHFGLAVPAGIEAEIDSNIGRVGDLPSGRDCWMPEDDAACAALACSDVPSIHYVHDGRKLEPAYVWYSPSALQFLRMDRGKLRWLLGAVKGSVSGKLKAKRKRRGKSKSALAPFVWIHPDDVPAHSAAILRQHLVRHEESRSMARVVVFGAPTEPDYGSGASVVSGTTGTMRTGTSAAGAPGAASTAGRDTSMPLTGPRASEHPLDNLVGRAVPCAWVTRVHWHGVCPRAMTVVMHPLPRDGWHMRAFYNMPRGMSSRQQRLLASQLQLAVRTGVLLPGAS